MADVTKKAIFEIRIESGPALVQAEKINRELEDIRFTRTKLNKAVRDNQKAEAELRAEIAASGKATKEQADALKKITATRDELNRKQNEAKIIQRGLSGQSRELENDLSGLTEKGLRFRDKMAEANLTALASSGILGQLAAQSRNVSSAMALVVEKTGKAEEELGQLRQEYEQGRVSEQRYREEADRLNAEIAQSTQEQKRLQAELDKVTTKSNALEAEVKQLNEAFRAGQITQDQYREGLKKIEQQQAGLNSRFDAFVKGQGAELKSTLSSLAVQYVGVGAAVYGVVGALSSAANAVVNYEAQLTKVSALGGEYKTRIEELGVAARSLGPQFGVGATEALGSVEALAKAGVSASDILGGALEGALTLAKSGSLDLAQAAEIASGAMTQFGLSGRDVTHIADLLSAGANNAQGEVSDFGVALRQSGLVASQTGLSIEETIGTLSAFASNALLGSDAGTSFRTMLLRLSAPTETASKEMERLGIAAFDSQGEFIGIEGLAGQLKERLSGLTDEQRQASLAIIFGQDAIRGANVLYQQGAEGIRNWVKTVDQSGFASDVASQKQDTLRGSIDRASAAWENFVISIEDGKGPLASAVRGSIDILSNFLEFFGGTGIEVATEKFATKVNEGIAKTFGALPVSLDEDALDAAFRNATIRVEAASKESADFIRNRVQDYATQIRTIIEQASDAGRQLTNDEKFRISLLRQEQTELVAVLREREAQVKKVAAAESTGAASPEAQVETLNTLRNKLEELKKTRDDIALTDKARLDQNEAEIEALEKKIRGFESLDRSLKNVKDSAEKAAPELDKVLFVAPENDATPNPPAAAPVADDITAFGLNPNSVDLYKITLEELAAKADEYRIAELEASTNLNDQLLALDLQWQNGSIESLAAYQEKRSAILAEMNAADLQRQQAIVDATAATTAILSEALITGAKDQKAYAKQALQVALKLAKDIVQIELVKANVIALAQPDSVATFGAAGAIRSAIITGLIEGVFAGLSKVVAGFAGGGEIGSPGGVVTSAWGAPIRRSNGDNVLARSASGPITLQTGEVVLNRSQRRELEQIAGRGVWGAIGLPGFAAGGQVSTRGTALVNASSPRPTPDQIVSGQLIAAIRDLAARPSIVAVEDIARGLDDRNTITQLTSA